MKVFHKKALTSKDLSVERQNHFKKNIIPPQQIITTPSSQNRSITPIKTVIKSPPPPSFTRIPSTTVNASQTLPTNPNIRKSSVQFITFQQQNSKSFLTDRYVSPKTTTNGSIVRLNSSITNNSIIKTDNSLSRLNPHKPIIQHQQPLQQQQQMRIVRQPQTIQIKLDPNQQVRNGSRSVSAPRAITRNQQKISFITNNNSINNSNTINIVQKKPVSQQAIVRQSSLQQKTVVQQVTSQNKVINNNNNNNKNTTTIQSNGKQQNQIIELSQRKPKKAETQVQNKKKELVPTLNIHSQQQQMQKQTQIKEQIDGVILVENQEQQNTYQSEQNYGSSEKKLNQTSSQEMISINRKKSEEIHDLVNKLETKISDFERKNSQKGKIGLSPRDESIINKYIIQKDQSKGKAKETRLSKISEQSQSVHYISSQQQLQQQSNQDMDQNIQQQQQQQIQQAQESPYQVATPLTSSRQTHDYFENSQEKQGNQQQNEELQQEEDEIQNCEQTQQEYYEQQQQYVNTASIKKTNQYNRFNQQQIPVDPLRSQESPYSNINVTSHNFNISGNKFPKMQPIDSIEIQNNISFQKQAQQQEQQQEQQNQQEQEEEEQERNIQKLAEEKIEIVKQKSIERIDSQNKINDSPQRVISPFRSKQKKQNSSLKKAQSLQVPEQQDQQQQSTEFKANLKKFQKHKTIEIENNKYDNTEKKQILDKIDQIIKQSEMQDSNFQSSQQQSQQSSQQQKFNNFSNTSQSLPQYQVPKENQKQFYNQLFQTSTLQSVQVENQSFNSSNNRSPSSQLSQYKQQSQYQYQRSPIEQLAFQHKSFLNSHTNSALKSDQIEYRPIRQNQSHQVTIRKFDHQNSNNSNNSHNVSTSQYVPPVTTFIKYNQSPLKQQQQKDNEEEQERIIHSKKQIQYKQESLSPQKTTIKTTYYIKRSNVFNNPQEQNNSYHPQQVIQEKNSLEVESRSSKIVQQENNTSQSIRKDMNGQSKKSLYSNISEGEQKVGSEVVTSDDLNHLINKECDELTKQLMDKFFPSTVSNKNI